MTKAIYAGYEEETLLTPHETSFNIDVYLYDTTFIQSKNGYAECVFSFYPKTDYDDRTLSEALHQAITEVELKKSPYSRKVAQQRCKQPGQKDVYYCSQLFLPKVNVEFENPSELHLREASLELHLRDDPDGDIYLQCSYVDIYDIDNGCTEAIKSTVPVDYDF
jgi:hypothetical protein